MVSASARSLSVMPPSDIDIGMMVDGFRVLGDAAHRIDAVEKGVERDGAAQRVALACPAGKPGERRVDLVIGEQGHSVNV